MKYPEPQHMLGLRVMGKKGLDAYDNAAEREIRAMVMGKKAYLFCQTDDACERAAMMYSFFGACKVKGKNPERWLTYVLDHIKETKDEDMYKLLPEFWEDIN